MLSLILLGAGCASVSPDGLPTAEDLGVDPKDEVLIDNAVCLEEPIVSDIGRKVYPTADEFAHLPFLGQIFTADSCGGAWIEEIDGVEGGMYTAGVHLWAKGKTTGVNTAEMLVEMGFVCSKEVAYPEDCREWLHEAPISIENLLRLKPEAGQFEVDECLNCG